MFNANIKQEQMDIDDSSHFEINSGLSAPHFSQDADLPEMIAQAQLYWLHHYEHERTKALTTAATKLHAEFQVELQEAEKKMRSDMQRELDSKTETYRAQYRSQLVQHMRALEEKHSAELRDMKLKEWCFHCGKEARLHCCYSVAYCSKECQQIHWSSHKEFCRRGKDPKNMMTVSEQSRD